MTLVVLQFLLLLLLQCGKFGNEPCVIQEGVKNATSRWNHWLTLLDPARLIIIVLSLWLITHASRRAVSLDKAAKDDPALEGVHELTWYHVIGLPILGSMMLLIFFYLFEYIQFFYTLLSVVISILAMYNLLQPAVKRLATYCKEKQLISEESPLLSKKTAAILAIAIATLWVLTGHWICLDVLGVGLCVLMIQFVRVPNLKISAFLLLSLLIYDVFWVFYSSSVFDANVMVEVAVKKAKNPVAIVADQLNLPEVAKSRPPLSIPGKLLVPSLIDGSAFAILGLGDIDSQATISPIMYCCQVLPGLLLCFAMRFDSLCQPNVSGGGSTSSQGFAKCLLLCQLWSYFSTALTGYATGLLIANLVAVFTDSAQPALLYLVPCALIPLIGKAVLQGDFKAMWNGPFTKLEKGYQTISQYSLLPT